MSDTSPSPQGGPGHRRGSACWEGRASGCGLRRPISRGPGGLRLLGGGAALESRLGTRLSSRRPGWACGFVAFLPGPERGASRPPCVPAPPACVCVPACACVCTPGRAGVPAGEGAPGTLCPGSVLPAGPGSAGYPAPSLGHRVGPWNSGTSGPAVCPCGQTQDTAARPPGTWSRSCTEGPPSWAAGGHGG